MGSCWNSWEKTLKPISVQDFGRGMKLRDSGDSLMKESGVWAIWEGKFSCSWEGLVCRIWYRVLDLNGSRGYLKELGTVFSPHIPTLICFFHASIKEISLDSENEPPGIRQGTWEESRKANETSRVCGTWPKHTKKMKNWNMMNMTILESKNHPNYPNPLWEVPTIWPHAPGLGNRVDIGSFWSFDPLCLGSAFLAEIQTTQCTRHFHLSFLGFRTRHVPPPQTAAVRARAWTGHTSSS